MSTIVAGMRAAADAGAGVLTFHLAEGPMKLTAVELLERAEGAAGILMDRGVQPGDRIGLLGPTRPEWVVWAAATWLAGAALVPLQMPLRLRDAEAFAARIASAVEAASCALVVADPALAAVVEAERFQDWTVRSPRSGWLPTVRAQDVAVIQYTSGSTADPKGVVITHEAVINQLASLTTFVGDQAGPTLGWVPLFHDMGLFLFFLFPLLHLPEGHLLPTEVFARQPDEWLRLVGATRATHLAAPQSAWLAALAAVQRKGIRVDLSSVRVASFAAEGVDPTVVDDVLAATNRLGMNRHALGGSYGLAEATLIVTASPLGQGIRLHTIDREALACAGIAGAVNSSPRRMVSAGAPFPGIAVRVVDPTGLICQDGTVGEIQVSSPSLMSGYDDGRGSPLVNGWLRTGDLGYLDQGELFVTGRDKDVMIVLGQNYFPEDFEWAAGRVPGVRPGRCVAVMDEHREGIVVLVEPADDAAAEALVSLVEDAVTDVVGTAPRRVVVVPRGSIEKTTSGKLRRTKMREAYLGGAFAS
jgi:fatty-acyl-CoA synthase